MPFEGWRCNKFRAVKLKSRFISFQQLVICKKPGWQMKFAFGMGPHRLSCVTSGQMLDFAGFRV
ncbi:hypothetical protein TSH20_08980 [Azospirillum sp. TSH20]|nr:hypothetical protein TSH20_08980 [Azospirillum sp. TSH20]